MGFLTLILLTWRIWWAPNNASKWQMGFLTLILLTWRIWWAPNNASR
jgi:cytochrome b561